MSQSLFHNWIHLIFSTKNRKPFLRDENVRKKLYEYLARICNEQGCKPVAIGGAEDHVHMLINLHKNQSLAVTVEKIKKYSSKWIKSLTDTDEWLNNFYWQNGYGAFSVSQSNLEKVIRYIENQEAHHKKFDFQEELRKMLTLHGVAFDEKYVWG